MPKILVPLDGSEFSAQIIPALRRLFSPAGCELILFQVGPLPEGYIGTPPRLTTVELPIPAYEGQQDVEQATHPIYASQEWDSRISALKDQLEPLAITLRSAGFQVQVAADLGNPADSIIAFATSQAADAVAMTTHGRSGLSRLLFGSVAEQVLRRVQIPVLLLNPSASEDQTTTE